MKTSKSEILALRRQLLSLQSQVLRLQLRRDVQLLQAAATPSALAARWLGRARPGSSWAELGLLAASSLGRRRGGRWAGQALLVWRLWRSLRQWLGRAAA